MSTYYIESKDNTLINFREYIMCNESGKEASQFKSNISYNLNGICETADSIYWTLVPK